MTFDAICSAVYSDLNLNGVPSAATSTRIRRYVNEGVRAVLREPGLERLADSDVPYRFTSVSGQARAAVPEAVARIHRLVDRTNALTLEAMPMDRYRRIDPDGVSTSGTPTHYVPIGRVAVATVPNPPLPLFSLSSQTIDVTQTVHVEGLVGGQRQTAEAVLNGTTPVQLRSNLGTNVLTFDAIEDFYLSAPARGIVPLLAGSLPGQELAQITYGALRPRYYGFYLWPTPAGAVTYDVDYRRELVDMVNDIDEPPLPTDFHSMLAAYARMREYEKADDDRYAIADREYRQALGRLKFSTQWASDELPVLGRAGRVGHSRLGANYPADSWR